VEVSDQPHVQADLSLANNSSAHSKGQYMGLKEGLDILGEKSLFAAVIQTPDLPARRLVPH